MFQPRFAPLVESGAKKQTFRPIPKRMPKIGEEFSGREWLGKPYRSKQRQLVLSEVVDLAEATLFQDALKYSGEWLDYLFMTEFGRLDGFANFEEMRNWFDAQYILPFTGIVITWS